MVGAIRFISFLSRSILSLNFFAVPLAQIFFSARTNAWLMENKPIRAQVTLMPSYKEDCPNMKRCTPSIGSIPMVESRSPRAPEIRPFTIDLDDTPAMMVKPKWKARNTQENRISWPAVPKLAQKNKGRCRKAVRRRTKRCRRFLTPYQLCPARSSDNPQLR